MIGRIAQRTFQNRHGALLLSQKGGDLSEFETESNIGGFVRVPSLELGHRLAEFLLPDGRERALELRREYERFDIAIETIFVGPLRVRSEERRVGKECRS